MHERTLSAVVPLLLALGPSAAAADRALTGVESQLLAVPNGERLHVTRAGSGKPVVLIPGLFGSAFGFRKVTARLPLGDWQVVVIEPLGVGDSDRPSEADYSLVAQADRVAAAMRVLGLREAVVAGHAVGASIAFRLAYRHPALVRSLVSIEGGPTESAVTPGFRRALRLAPLLRLFGGVRLVRGKVRGQLAGRSADPGWVTDEVVDGYTKGAARDLGATLTAFRRMGEAREREPLAPHLSAIRCPVRLLLGAAPHEGGPGMEEIQLLRDRLASFEIVRVPQAGNFVFEEAPGVVVDAIVQAEDGSRARDERLASAPEVRS